LGVKLNGPVSNASVLLFIVVKRIDSELANTLRAVRSGVTLVAVAAHGGVLVPEVVNVVVIIGSDLLDSLAGTVSRAHEASGDGTVRSLACRAVVAIKALAVTTSTVADTLVGALTVLVSRVIHDAVIRIDHVRVLLGSSLRIHGVIDDDR
jgi:hypothetical protein